MDAIIARIKSYVLIIDGSIPDDSFLDFVVRDVVDRALIFMNRVQLIEDYEADNSKEAPIPRQLERTLAGVVVGAYKTIKARNVGEMAISSVSDNGQSISYKNEVASFLNTSSEAEIFAGSLELLKQYRLPTVIKAGTQTEE